MGDLPVRLRTETFVVDRETLEGMLDAARYGEDDNDQIIDGAQLKGVEDAGSGGLW